MLVFLLVLTLLSPFCFEHTLMFSCLWAVLRCFRATGKQKALSSPGDKAKVSTGDEWNGNVDRSECLASRGPGDRAVHTPPGLTLRNLLTLVQAFCSCLILWHQHQSQPGKYESSYEMSSVQFEERCPVSWKSCAVWKECDPCVCVYVGWKKQKKKKLWIFRIPECLCIMGPVWPFLAMTHPVYFSIFLWIRMPLRSIYPYSIMSHLACAAVQLSFFVELRCCTTVSVTRFLLF